MAERFGVIPEAEPGSEQAFARDEFIAQLDLLTSECSTPLVLALHGPWGTGKTHLLKTWQKKLDEAKRPYVYYNAWKNDHGDDPFVSFVAEIHEAALRKLDDNLVQTLVEKAAKAMPGIIQLGSKIVLRMACKAAGIDKDDLSIDDLHNALKTQITMHKVQRESVEGFKQELSELAQKLGDKFTEEHPGNDAPPLLVIVDELDRCRPDFAISLLERVKHVLSVRGVVFLFAVDMEQLAHTAKCLYGQGMDAEGYFRRFFDTTISIPYPGMSDWIKYTAESVNYVRGGNPGVRIDSAQCAAICSLLGLSLRESSQLLTSLRLLLPAQADTILPEIAFLLLALRIKNLALYSNWRRGNITPNSIWSLFDKKKDYRELSIYTDYLGAIGHNIVAFLVCFGADGKILALLNEAVTHEIGKGLFARMNNADQIQDAKRYSGFIGVIVRRIELLIPEGHHKTP